MHKKYHKCKLCKIIYKKNSDISYFQWKHNKYCSIKCRLRDMKGKNNPNYGNHVLSIKNKGINNPNYKDGHTTYQHYCKCGKKIHRESIQCKSCYAKSRTNELSNAYKSGKTINNKCKDCGKHISYSGIRCRSCAYKNDYKLGTRISKKGKDNNRYGKLMKPVFMKYKNIWMRSSWEVAYAKYLTKNRIKWQYESKTFDLGKTTYTPDFYLPATDTYLEIKGYASDYFIKKIKIFRKNYSNVKITILTQYELKLQGII